MTDESGFTLPEVIVASLLTLLLAIPAFTLVQRANDYALATRSRLVLNAQARQAWTLLGSGSGNLSAVTTQTDSYGLAYVRGIRGLTSAPTASALRNGGQFVLSDNPLSISGDAFPTLTITCLGAANPIPDCVSTENRTITGWLGSDPVIASAGTGGVAGATVLLTLTDPFQALRARVPPRAATERYRTIFTLNSEAPP
jgi:hypothetical protein